MYPTLWITIYRFLSTPLGIPRLVSPRSVGELDENEINVMIFYRIIYSICSNQSYFRFNVQISLKIKCLNVYFYCLFWSWNWNLCNKELLTFPWGNILLLRNVSWTSCSSSTRKRFCVYHTKNKRHGLSEQQRGMCWNSHADNKH